MEDILDQEDVGESRKRNDETNNKLWASACLIAYWFIVFIKNYQISNYNPRTQDAYALDKSTAVLTILSFIFFIVGLVYAIRSYRRRETRTVTYFLGVYGYFLILGVVVLLFILNLVVTKI